MLHMEGTAMTGSLNSLLNAFINGVHSHQVRLFRQTGVGDPECFSCSGCSDDCLRELDDTCSALLRQTPGDMKYWFRTGEGTVGGLVGTLEDSDCVLDGRLPVMVVSEYLHRKVPGADVGKVRSLAVLYQMTLEEARDGDDLQLLLAICSGLGLAVCLDDIGLYVNSEELDDMARELAERSCECPFDASEKGWRLGLEKIKYWGEKFSGRITAGTYADELLQGAAAGLLECVRWLGPANVCVFGHSFSMQVHWSSHGTFPCIAAAVFERENPSVKWSWVSQGGLRAGRALEKYLNTVLDSRPDITLLVMNVMDDKDFDALGTIVESLVSAGGRVIMPDKLAYRGHYIGDDRPDVVELVEKLGGEVMRVGRILDEHPERESFVCLDGLHMGPGYHKLMALKLLEHLCQNKKSGATL